MREAGLRMRGGGAHGTFSNAFRFFLPSSPACSASGTRDVSILKRMRTLGCWKTEPGVYRPCCVHGLNLHGTLYTRPHTHAHPHSYACVTTYLPLVSEDHRVVPVGS